MNKGSCSGSRLPCQLLVATVLVCLVHYLGSLLASSTNLSLNAKGKHKKAEPQADPTPAVQTTTAPTFTTTMALNIKIFDGLRDVTKFIKPKNPIFYNGVWQLVDDKKYEIYLYSAFFDDRPGLPARFVRVIGIVQEDNRTLFCLLWKRDSNMPHAVKATRVKTGAAVTRHYKNFEPVILSCQIPDGEFPPEYVSIITVNSFQPSTLLLVQIPDKPPEPLEFGTCVSVTYWKQDPYRIVEWLELHRLWGVQEVTVYNNSLSDDVSRVFAMYAQEGFVDFRQAPNSMPDEGELTILLNMSPTLNDCMYRNMYRYKKLVCTDFDEVIVPRIHNNYEEMLSAVDKVQPSLHPQRSYMFRNVYFFLDFPANEEEPWYLTSIRYRRRVNPSQYGYSVKCITDPLVCVALQNHLCWLLIDKHNTAGWLIDVNIHYGMNHHYKFCHFDKFLKQPGKCRSMMEEETTDDTMLRFLDKITQQASEKLWMLDMGGLDNTEDDGATLEDVKYGVMATNDSDVTELERDLKDMAGSGENAGNVRTIGKNNSQELVEDSNSLGKRDGKSDAADNKGKPPMEKISEQGKGVEQNGEKDKLRSVSNNKTILPGNNQNGKNENNNANLNRSNTKGNTKAKDDAAKKLFVRKQEYGTKRKGNLEDNKGRNITVSNKQNYHVNNYQGDKTSIRPVVQERGIEMSRERIVEQKLPKQRNETQ